MKTGYRRAVQIGVVGAMIGATGAPAASATSVGTQAHRYVSHGTVITWGNKADMSDLKVVALPDAVDSATSAEDEQIGRAVLSALHYSQPGALGAHFAADYCSYSPDSFGKANFKPACAAHDACYSATSTSPRLACDNTFKSALNKICNASFDSWWEVADRKACNGVAWTYYQAVRKLGKSHYHGRGSNA